MKLFIVKYFQIIDLLIQGPLYSEVIHVQKCRLVINFGPTLHPLHILVRFRFINHEFIHFKLLLLHNFVIGRRIWWRQIHTIINIDYAAYSLNPYFCLFFTSGEEMGGSVDLDDWEFRRILQMQLCRLSLLKITLNYIPECLSLDFHIRMIVRSVRKYLPGKVYVNVPLEVIIDLEEISRFTFRFFVEASHY